MSMRLIFGRAGTGKSQFCLNEIKKHVSSSDLDNKIYLIVPEQFSYASEKKLLEVVRNK